jgi:peptidoglycan/xylan/chitin deacetylase (PgdA/CDA1 family)
MLSGRGNHFFQTMKQRFYLIGVALLSYVFFASYAPAQDSLGTKVTEPQTAPKPKARDRKSKVTGRVWPARAGEASLCLWADDKLAALSLTIDDNCAPNVDWWLAKSKELDIHLTWFLVTNGINKQKFSGSWELWKRVRDAGHAIESHTVTHLSAAKNPDTWKGIDWEYAESVKQLETGLAGHRINFLAYPGGGNAKFNDPKVASKYYLAARGTRGKLNGPLGINYMQVNAMSSPGFDPAKPFNNLNNLLDENKGAYRGWAVIIYHFIKDKTNVQKHLDFYAANSQDLWGAKFGDVALYAQERDSATLTVDENTASQIKFTLKDEKDDERFFYPLSVKVRLPDTWKNIRVAQNGKDIESRIVEHEGGRYAIVKAVPDKGSVILAPQK